MSSNDDWENTKRLSLRIPVAVHRLIAEQADLSGRSVHEEIATYITQALAHAMIADRHRARRARP